MRKDGKKIALRLVEKSFNVVEALPDVGVSCVPSVAQPDKIVTANAVTPIAPLDALNSSRAQPAIFAIKLIAIEVQSLSERMKGLVKRRLQ